MMKNLDKDVIREQVMQAYRGRCIFPVHVSRIGESIINFTPCIDTATDVHEIIPKSKTRNWNTFKNRVPLCKQHHEEVHKYGYKRYQKELEFVRDSLISGWNITWQEIQHS